MCTTKESFEVKDKYCIIEIIIISFYYIKTTQRTIQYLDS